MSAATWVGARGARAAQPPGERHGGDLMSAVTWVGVRGARAAQPPGERHGGHMSRTLSSGWGVRGGARRQAPPASATEAI